MEYEYLIKLQYYYLKFFRGMIGPREGYTATRGGVHSDWYIATAVHCEHDSALAIELVRTEPVTHLEL